VRSSLELDSSEPAVRREALPRWALSSYFRKDGLPVSQDPAVFAHVESGSATARDARRFVSRLTEHLGVDEACAVPGHEDRLYGGGERGQSPSRVGRRRPLARRGPWSLGPRSIRAVPRRWVPCVTSRRQSQRMGGPSSPATACSTLSPRTRTRSKPTEFGAADQ